MCKFCDDNICKDYDIAIKNKPYIHLYLANCFGDIVIRAEGENTTFYIPKYCPECGRRINIIERGE